MYKAEIEGSTREFASLSLRDLLAARDQYHFHLMNKANVIGTAVGRYLIRKSDPWPKANRETLSAEGDRKPPTKEKRTFENSEVRDYSWPCVIVVVNNWVTDFGTGEANELHASELVPKTLYMPDGRMVPVCVVAAEPLPPQAALPSWVWPSGLLSPGYPVVSDHQRVDRVASLGCLVTDGHTTFGLTNRHVSGAPGEPVYTWRRGQMHLIGTATDKQLTRVKFEDVYPDYPVRRTYLNADIGLVELRDLDEWTSDIFELGPVGELVDLHEANLGLTLIDAEVSAHGATSGHLEGLIKGLFYRYKSVGGYDYVADFLIAPPDEGDSSTQEGDSGTVWHLRSTKRGQPELLPLCVEWGAQALSTSKGGRRNFALATSLTNVCKLLDVELVHDVDRGAYPTWGQMGHYTIGAYATTILTSANLKTLMAANVERISFVKGDLNPKGIKAKLEAVKNGKGIVPLADVPDLIWKHLPSSQKGGRDTSGGKLRSTGPEHPTHFADIDEKNSKGDTLRDLSIADTANVNVAFWQKFYTDLGHKTFDKRGCLPFRVWQFFEAMVDALRDPTERGLDRYVAAAGLLAHYVGDACQPLHGSMYADGYGDKKKTVTVHHTRGKKAGQTEEITTHVGAGVHSSFETHMLDRKSKEIVAALPGVLNGWASKVKPIASGRDAAIEIVRLMDRAAKTLPPTKIVDAYVKAGDKDSAATQETLWKKFHKETIELLADGSDVLAKIWEAAWVQGKGEQRTNQFAIRGEDELRALYEDPSFVPSLALDDLAGVLK